MIKKLNIHFFARLCKLLTISTLLLVNSGVSAQDTGGEEEKKTKFIDKIGHWFVAYSMSGQDFIDDERIEFKSKAFAEVYVEGIIEHDAWMFTLLNKITQFRYESKQDPHVLFEVKFKPTSDLLDNYEVLLKITTSTAVSANLDKIGNDVVSEFFSGKTYTEPMEAIEDIEKAIQQALTTLAGKLGNELAPNLMVKYEGELFWNGHDIHVLDDTKNSIELEAIGKDGNPLNPTDISWTNASPVASSAKARVDITDISNKEVSLNSGSDNLTVNVTRVGVDLDMKELLKQLLLEVLTAKTEETELTLDTLRTEETLNQDSVAIQIARLEGNNSTLTAVSGSGELTPLFAEPILISTDDNTAFGDNQEKKKGFRLLRRKMRLKDTIQRKLNLVAFIDLVVDDPEKLKPLLDLLIRNSGRLIARLILNNDSESKYDTAKNIVIEFVNNNIEEIANAN